MSAQMLQSQVLPATRASYITAPRRSRAAGAVPQDQLVSHELVDSTLDVWQPTRTLCGPRKPSWSTIALSGQLCSGACSEH